jgi:hypothetical protein
VKTFTLIEKDGVKAFQKFPVTLKENCMQISFGANVQNTSDNRKIIAEIGKMHLGSTLPMKASNCQWRYRIVDVSNCRCKKKQRGDASRPDKKKHEQKPRISGLSPRSGSPLIILDIRDSDSRRAPIR